MAVLVVGAAVLGLIAGSFANVPIYRWPRGGTVTVPSRSTCPECGSSISAQDNVPVVSWLLLRGRCRHCGARIPVRYPLIEVATGLLFGGVVWTWGLDPLVPALLVFAWALVVASAIDLEHRIIPNRLTLRLPIVLVVLVGGAAVVDGDLRGLVRALIAAVAIPAVMLAFSELFRLLRGQPGIGMGDVKLGISLGLVVGYLGGWHLVVFAYASVIAAVVVAVVLMLAGRARMASRIPFGPYLAIGALVAVFGRDRAVDALQRAFGL
jgi:leader peptidase (prepilin peptidase) / N-methyltransferase